METFHLQRDEDESGVSGTGKVAQGVIFDNGKVSLSFIPDATSLDIASVNVYDSIEDVRKIHGHDGKTKVEFE